jgi:chemotaxis protein methyltransferase CheR
LSGDYGEEVDELQEWTELDSRHRADYESFVRQVYQKSGIDLNLYKSQQMYRRLWGMVERANLQSFTDYFALINRDSSEWAAFLDRMTINVSELFRNPEKWEEMRLKVLPGLLKRGKPLRIWSAGCSIGAEPYTLAMLLDDLKPGVRHYLLATDIDQKILERARQGVFTANDIRSVPASYRSRYLRAAGCDFEVIPELRQRVTFRKHNLLADPFEKEFDLIVCRNVVIYFTEEAKDRLFERFHASLAPGGVLFVGGTERIFNYREIGFESRIPFFYERVH